MIRAITTTRLATQFVPRKKCSWEKALIAPQTRVVTKEVDDLIEALCNSREELAENERVEQLRDFLEKEVASVVEATEIAFYTDAEETVVYNELRARAVDIENAVLEMMQGRDMDTFRKSMPSWRWELYEDILDTARHIACVRGSSELDEDCQDVFVE
jgi:hypothetical protein